MAKIICQWDSGVSVSFEGSDEVVARELLRYANSILQQAPAPIQQQTGWNLGQLMTLWDHLKDGPRRLLIELAKQPTQFPEGYPIEELATALGLDGPKALGGMFASIHRYTNRLFPDNPELVRRDANTGRKYVMSEEVADNILTGF